MKEVPINKYRKQLMGFSTLGVLCVHSNRIVHWPSAISKLMEYGGIGVYIFIYLSGIGLYNSLKRSKGIKDFYISRFCRVLIPYVLVASTWYVLEHLLIERDVIAFFYELSTLAFWIEHKGAWYVAMLLPLYLILPFFYNWVEHEHRSIKVCFCAFSILAIAFGMSFLNKDLFEHLKQVMFSYFVFLIGYYEAGTLFNKNKEYGLVIICLFIFVIKSVTPLKNFDFMVGLSYALLGIPVLIIFSKLLQSVQNNIIDNVLGFFGKYSLEMYLWNAFLISAFFYFEYIDKATEVFKNNAGYVVYASIVVLGILLSIIYGKISEKISQIIQKK